MQDEWITHAPGWIPEPRFELWSYWLAVKRATRGPQEGPIEMIKPIR